MKILNFGSLNIDLVYSVDHIVLAGETISSEKREQFAGGKGLNQSVAASRAGAQVLHAGAVGDDGEFLVSELRSAGVSTENIAVLSGTPSGHAVIQVSAAGQNSIIVYGGSNRMLSSEYIQGVLSLGEPGDTVLVQNEINAVGFILSEAKRLGMRTAFNPSPITEGLKEYPLDCVDLFILNETEGGCLTGKTEPAEILSSLLSLYPSSSVILTLGKDGAYYSDGETTVFQGIFETKAVDTTAAGDTFCGFYLALSAAGSTPKEALEAAAMASSIAVSRHGAAPSIPTITEVEEALSARKAAPV